MGNHTWLPINAASHPRSTKSSATWVQKPQNSYSNIPSLYKHAHNITTINPNEISNIHSQ
jgi:hypothetical protein